VVAAATGVVYDVHELLLAGTAAVVRINAPGEQHSLKGWVCGWASFWPAGWLGVWVAHPSRVGGRVGGGVGGWRGVWTPLCE